MEQPPTPTTAAERRRAYYLANRERINAHHMAYYQANRERLMAQMREYHQTKGKAWNAARIRDYRHRHPQETLARQREYRANNVERTRALSRAHHARHREERNAKKRQYWHENRERFLEKKRLYNAAHAAQRSAYYQEHRYQSCQQTLNLNCYRAMERIQSQCPEAVALYFQQYPFEAAIERHIRWRLSDWHIYPSQERYADCYDAGMLAYLYSIHRCALMGYDHTFAYIKKMVRILVSCALVVGAETQAICREHHLQAFSLDNDDFARL